MTNKTQHKQKNNRNRKDMGQVKICLKTKLYSLTRC